MEIKLTDKNLSDREKEELKNLLERRSVTKRDDLHQMWYLMDLIWDEYQCDNKNLDWDKIGRFYSHPVWLLNGLFAEQHAESMQHRHAISDWVVKKGFKKIIDYGGGFGTLARLIAEKDKNIKVTIFEPHPSEFGLKRAAEYDNITISAEHSEEYDCLVCTDVLEHVPDPIKTFSEMIDMVKPGGYLIIANHFYPSIKCHLPSTFHLRYSFDFLAGKMGLIREGLLSGSHATIFKKNKNVKYNWVTLRLIETLSGWLYPLLSIARYYVRYIKKVFKK